MNKKIQKLYTDPWFESVFSSFVMLAATLIISYFTLTNLIHKKQQFEAQISEHLITTPMVDVSPQKRLMLRKTQTPQGLMADIEKETHRFNTFGFAYDVRTQNSPGANLSSYLLNLSWHTNLDTHVFDFISYLQNVCPGILRVRHLTIQRTQSSSTPINVKVKLQWIVANPE
jgi:hypothetical protein